MLRFDQWTNCHMFNHPDGAARIWGGRGSILNLLSLERFAKRLITGPRGRRTLCRPRPASLPGRNLRRMTATVYSARGQSTAPRFRPRHRDFDRCHLSPLRPRANSLRRSAALEDALRLRLESVFRGAEASGYARYNAPESGSPATCHRFCFIPASLPAAVSSFLVL